MSTPLSTRLRIQWALCAVVGTVLLYIFCVKFFSSSTDIQQLNSIEQESPVFEDTYSLSEYFPKHVVQLVEAIQAAAREAAGGQEPPTMTEAEQQEWMASNPCKSRSELPFMYSRRSGIRDMAENPFWSLVLVEYMKLHRTCMQKVGSNLKEAFLNQTITKGCKFAIADVDTAVGLANRILSITSTILYAILTQRVVLLPNNTLLTELMCEPFIGSSWNLNNYGGFSWNPKSMEAVGVWAFHRDVYTELDVYEATANHSSSSYSNSSGSTYFASSMDHFQYHPYGRFFCDREQSSFAGVTWLYFTGCIYIIPRFFSIPSFRSTLQALFPGRFVLTQVLRTVMIPSDKVWEKVVMSDTAHFKNTTGVRRVGVQVRYYYGISEYTKMNDVVNNRILTCLVQNRILPPRDGYQTPGPRSVAPSLAPSIAPQPNMSSLSLAVKAKARLREEISEVAPKTRVFIASLHEGFFDHIAKDYLSLTPESDDNVTVLQLTNLQVQQFGVGVDTQSLVEIFLLSFSDVLVSNPLSTFGAVAQAYGSLIPWMIEMTGFLTNITEDNIAPCERDTTVDVCYQTAETTYACPYNRDVNELRLDDVAPYFQGCLENVRQAGVSLVTDYEQEISEISPETQQGLNNADVPNSMSEPPIPSFFSWLAQSSNEIMSIFFAGSLIVLLIYARQILE